MAKSLNDPTLETSSQRSTPAMRVPKVPRTGKTPASAPLSPAVHSTASALSAQRMPQIVAAQLFPTDWYSPSDQIPVFDEATYQKRMETIKGQQRAVGVLQENLILGRALLKAEGLSIDCEIEATTNDIKRQNLTTTGIKLQQAQTKTAIEHTKLTSLQQELRGVQIESALKEQVWNVKLENLSTGLDAARLHLHSQREALRQQFPSYSPSALPKVS